jgi:hypothetical protein
MSADEGIGGTITRPSPILSRITCSRDPVTWYFPSAGVLGIL